MVRNANKSEFQTSKMATGGHFEKRMNHFFKLLFVNYFLITDKVLDWESVRKYFILLVIIIQPGTHEIQAGNLASVALASIR